MRKVTEITQAAYDLAPFDDPIASARDFVFAPPNMAACFESEFFANPLVTQLVKRGGQELSHYGGVIYTLKSRTDINHVKDLKGKIVTASDFKLCQVPCQLSLRVNRVCFLGVAQ